MNVTFSYEGVQKRSPRGDEEKKKEEEAVVAAGMKWKSSPPPHVLQAITSSLYQREGFVSGKRL